MFRDQEEKPTAQMSFGSTIPTRDTKRQKDYSIENIKTKENEQIVAGICQNVWETAAEI